MNSPSQRTLRVLVTGASGALWTSSMGGPRSDYAFPRVLEEELRGRGFAAQVRNSARLGSPTVQLFEAWEEDVLAWSPDVIVSMVGQYETIHLFLPHRYERFSNRPDFRPDGLRTPWRRRVVRPAWRAAAAVQAQVDDRLGRARLRPHRLDRVAEQFLAYVWLCQQVASPAQLVVELPPPGARLQEWFPGMLDRVTELNARLEASVRRLGLPHVQYVPILDTVRGVVGADVSLGWTDGIHFTPEVHRAVGTMLADRVLAVLPEATSR